MPERIAALRRADWARLAEWVVLAGVLAIAALISYTHLRDVWRHAGAPWENLGPLLPDGLFASAWLQMRRRRRQAVVVGWLAWLAGGVALLATLAGNIAAAVIDGVWSPLDIVVAAFPAAVLALAWELVTGHGRQVSTLPEMPPGDVAADDAWRGADLAPGLDMSAWPAASPLVTTAEPVEVEVGGEVAPFGFTGTTETEDGWHDYAAHLIGRGFGRKRLARELDLTEHEARELLAKLRGRLESREVAG